VVVNEAFARKYFPSVSPMGHLLEPLRRSLGPGRNRRCSGRRETHGREGEGATGGVRAGIATERPGRHSAGALRIEAGGTGEGGSRRVEAGGLIGAGRVLQ